MVRFEGDALEVRLELGCDAAEAWLNVMEGLMDVLSVRDGEGVRPGTEVYVLELLRQLLPDHADARRMVGERRVTGDL